jgi:hypothetical protein
MVRGRFYVFFFPVTQHFFLDLIHSYFLYLIFDFIICFVYLYIEFSQHQKKNLTFN